jgi:hypothetical protein
MAGRALNKHWQSQWHARLLITATCRYAAGLAAGAKNWVSSSAAARG